MLHDMTIMYMTSPDQYFIHHILVLTWKRTSHAAYTSTILAGTKPCAKNEPMAIFREIWLV